MHSSGSDDSFSEDEFSEHEDSLAIADLQSRVPVSPSSSSPSYAALVYRIRQEYCSDGMVPATISHIAYALVMDSVLLATIVGGVYSVRIRLASKSNQSKARSLPALHRVGQRPPLPRCQPRYYDVRTAG